MFFVYQDHLSIRLRTNTCPPPNIKTTRLVDSHNNEICLAVATMTHPKACCNPIRFRVHRGCHIFWSSSTIHNNCHGSTKTHSIHNYPSGYPGRAWSLRGDKSGHIISAKELASWTSHHKANMRQHMKGKTRGCR